jgi:predicted alpha/beta hydrolase
MGVITVPAVDGYPLPATLFEPADAPRAIVIVSPATATPRGFYRAFCEYLAADGAVVLTYDYRGTFEAPKDLRRMRARMRDWGELDFPGVVTWMSERYPELPIYTVGHSVGGHVLLMAPNNAKITRAVNVASQSGHWAFFRGFERYKVLFMASVITPLLTRLCGYFPGKHVVFGTNLAPGILYEWMGWCMQRRYFFADPSMRETLARASHLHAQVTMLGIADDPWATPRAIEAIRPGFFAAPNERVELDPRAYGLGPVGHMGFFRSANAALWPRVTEALGLA